VVDVGKSNVKVLVTEPGGHVLAARSVVNRVLPGPPWRHHDLKGLSEWVFGTLGEMARDHRFAAIVPSGHGSGTILTLADPDAGGDGAAVPMLDYEEACPAATDAVYRAAVGDFGDRGGRVMMASTHQARQMLRAEIETPEAFAGAAHALAVAPYWAWRLSGVAASEVSALGAQSQLWNAGAGRWAGIVGARNWGRLLPPVKPAWEDLGPVRPALARQYGIPAAARVHLGGHDSSLNFYRYLAAGIEDFTLVATGTWIVAMTDRQDIPAPDEMRGMVMNADVFGRPVAGALTMGGREYALIAGEGNTGGITRGALMRVVAAGTVSVPTFGSDGGQFPGTEGRGRVDGAAPVGPEDRRALALLHAVMLTVACAEALGAPGRLVLDGTFLREAQFAPLVAALMPGVRVLAAPEIDGVAAGAALLAGHAARSAPVALPLAPVLPAEIPGLAGWAALWRDRAERAMAEAGT
jgi:sugar (pentulose or hexulose) kinase